MAKDLTQGRIMPMLIKFTIPLILEIYFSLLIMQLTLLLSEDLLEKKHWLLLEYAIQ